MVLSELLGGSIVVEGQLLRRPGYAPNNKGRVIEIATTGNVAAAPAAKINASGTTHGNRGVAIDATLDLANGGPSVPLIVGRHYQH